jgi:hypothetical protein
MVCVQMADEDFVEQIVGNLEAADANIGTRAAIEYELVTIAQLDQETRGRLTLACGRHACATGDDAHLIGSQVFGIGEVGFAIGLRTDRTSESIILTLRVRHTIAGSLVKPAQVIGGCHNQDQPNDYRAATKTLRGSSFPVPLLMWPTQRLRLGS